MSRQPRHSSDDLLRDLQNALAGTNGQQDADFARLDYRRGERVGAPEIILAENKTDEQVLTLVGRMLDRGDRVLVSRIADGLVVQIANSFPGFSIEHPVNSRMIRVVRVGAASPSTGGRVGIFTAGTSDLPLAEETRLVAEEMGCNVRVWADMGVAGLHRLVQPFREAIESDVGAIVVVAGMDGALPSVIAGLSPVPVIGLPSSVGYGYGGNGEAALMAMLQTCAPGLTVVNIDNSVGAGIAAARIANQKAIGD